MERDASGRLAARRARRCTGGLALDVVAVVAFVVIGRSVHTRGLGLAGLCSTAWPFLLGVGVGWAPILWRRGQGQRLLAGAEVVVATVAVGMVLRVVAGQGTAFAFVLVALGFLGLAMLGWRLVVALLTERRDAS